MILETVRINADWLADATNGVNAMLATVPRDAGDPQPAAVAVRDATRDGVVGRRQIPHASSGAPELFVNFEPDGLTDMDPEVWTTYRDCDALPISIRYVVENAATEAAMRDAYYTLRAAQKSLRRLNENTNAAATVRNQVELVELVRLRHSYPFAPVSDKVVVAALVAIYMVRDLAP